MSASLPADMVNQKLADLGIPNQYSITSSRSSLRTHLRRRCIWVKTRQPADECARRIFPVGSNPSTRRKFAGTIRSGELAGRFHHRASAGGKRPLARHAHDVIDLAVLRARPDEWAKRAQYLERRDFLRGRERIAGPPGFALDAIIGARDRGA